jgi:diguanylate cyclase (GGDEF)-like protein
VQERRHVPRTRALKAGKILLNDRRSVIDCVVRNYSEAGACLQVASVVGVPPIFDLQIDGESIPHACEAVWHAQNRIGIVFHSRPEQAAGESESPAAMMPDRHDSHHDRGEHAAGHDLVREELLSLRAALNEVQFGIVLLDAELRAQFINRAFRKMWRLSDDKADRKPAFVSLMYHGRDIRAYDIAEKDLQAYIAERVALVKVGDPTPMDIRQANGEVLRFQCTALPNGGRMLSYTYVTDIVTHTDELETLRTALDNVEQGIMLLDGDLTVQFMNRAARKMWKVSDEMVERKPNYGELVNTARNTNVSGVPAEELDRYIAQRISAARNGNPTPADLQLADGRTMRLQCAVLPSGGRMMTYSDVTDLVRSAAELQVIATTDSLTGLHNRRRFLELAEAEWHRFQRYQRPLSLLLFDVDNFKFINDTFRHDTGDRAIMHLAAVARDDKRPSDELARIGGDEFVLLLPETDVQQAGTVAERLREKAAQSALGVAGATLSMSGVPALLKAADEALYQAKLLGRNRVSVALPASVHPAELAAE